MKRLARDQVLQTDLRGRRALYLTNDVQGQTLLFTQTFDRRGAKRRCLLESAVGIARTGNDIYDPTLDGPYAYVLANEFLGLDAAPNSGIIRRRLPSDDCTSHGPREITPPFRPPAGLDVARSLAVDRGRFFVTFSSGVFEVIPSPTFSVAGG